MRSLNKYFLLLFIGLSLFSGVYSCKKPVKYSKRNCKVEKTRGYCGNYLLDLKVNKNGNCIIVSRDGKISILGKKEPFEINQAGDLGLNIVSYDRKGDRLVGHNRDGGTFTNDLKSEDSLWERVEGENRIFNPSGGVKYSKFGNRVCVLSASKKELMLLGSDWSLLDTIIEDDNSFVIGCFNFSHDEEELAYHCYDTSNNRKLIRVKRLGGDENTTTLEAPLDEVDIEYGKHLEYSNGGGEIVVTVKPNKSRVLAIVWDKEMQYPTLLIRNPQKKAKYVMAKFSPNDKFVMVSNCEKICIYNKSGEMNYILDSEPRSSTVFNFVFDSDGHKVTSVGVMNSFSWMLPSPTVIGKKRKPAERFELLILKCLNNGTYADSLIMFFD